MEIVIQPATTLASTTTRTTSLSSSSKSSSKASSSSIPEVMYLYRYASLRFPAFCFPPAHTYSSPQPLSRSFSLFARDVLRTPVRHRARNPRARVVRLAPRRDIRHRCAPQRGPGRRRATRAGGDGGGRSEVFGMAVGGGTGGRHRGDAQDVEAGFGEGRVVRGDFLCACGDCL